MTEVVKSKRGGRRTPQPGRPPKLEQRPHFETALEYAMDVINDSSVTARRRDTMAYWVLRTGHQQATHEASGKKAERKAAAQKATDQFTVPPPPSSAKPLN